MTQVLFPTRQRCLACRGSLGKTVHDPVLDGLYCSPRCAGVAQPTSDVTAAPRECKTLREGVWHFKRKYRSESEIPDKIRQDASTSWYGCSHCHHLHIGHSRMGTPEQLRVLHDLSVDLADVLVKLRGQATHKQVAAAAGVRPIRIKELEQGIKHADGLATLAAVLKVYRVRLGVQLPADLQRRPVRKVG